MKFLFLSLIIIIIICHNIVPMNTLRCAHDCVIDPTPFGSQDPIRIPCDTIDVDTTITVCSVFLILNFETGYIDGALNEKSRSIDQSSVLHLSSQFRFSGTQTFINFQCSTTDHCDENFVRETISSSKWSDLNETQVRTNISSLLFEDDSSFDDLICDNDLVCPWFQQCVAELIQNSSVSKDHQINFNNRFPCGETLDSHVKFDQYFHAPAATKDMIMKIFCNRNECNQRKIVELVYNILENDFILPLNYSAYTPTSHGLNQRIHLLFIITIVCFHFCFYLIFRFI